MVMNEIYFFYHSNSLNLYDGASFHSKPNEKKNTYIHTHTFKDRNNYRKIGFG